MDMNNSMEIKINEELRILGELERELINSDLRYKSNILSIICNNDDDYVKSYLPAWRAWPGIMKVQHIKLNEKRNELIEEKFKIWSDN